jgi:hypothetical protein
LPCSGDATIGFSAVASAPARGVACAILWIYVGALSGFIFNVVNRDTPARARRGGSLFDCGFGDRGGVRLGA